MLDHNGSKEVVESILLYMTTFGLNHDDALLCSEMFCCYPITEVTKAECDEFLDDYYYCHHFVLS